MTSITYCAIVHPPPYFNEGRMHGPRTSYFPDFRNAPGVTSHDEDMPMHRDQEKKLKTIVEKWMRKHDALPARGPDPSVFALPPGHGVQHITIEIDDE